MSLPWIAALDPIIKILKASGILKDPEAEAQLRAQLAQIQAQQDQAFADYIKATTPDWSRVYPFANTLIALVRPSLAVFMPLSFMLWPDRWVQIMDAFAKMDVFGKFFIAAPTVVFVMGRDGLRALVALLGARMKNGASADLLREALPPGIPEPRPAAPFTSKSGFRKDPSDLREGP